MNTDRPDSILCPQCQTSVPVHPGYINWCDRCEWNVHVDPPKEFPSFFDKMNRRFGEKFGEQLFRAVMEEASSLRPSLNLSRVLVYLLAGLVHITALILAVSGILLLIFGWPNILMIIGGVACLGFAWGARPRLGSVPSGVLARDTHPELYALTGRVADVLGLKRLDGIAVSDEFNASFQRVGLRGRTYITLGLPLFSILPEEEQVALIGHEVAHGVNGDTQRHLFVGTAMQTLADWDHLLRPESLWSGNFGIFSIGTVPFNLMMLGLASIVRAVQYAMAILLYRDAQRAEYLADQLATKAAGSEAMLRLLEKLYFGGCFNMALQRTALNKGRKLFEELNTEIAAMPDREKERIRRRSERADSVVDESHPPTPYRTKFIQRHGFDVGAQMLSEEQRENIIRELAGSFEAVEYTAIDRYKSRLYA